MTKNSDAKKKAVEARIKARDEISKLIISYIRGISYLTMPQYWNSLTYEQKVKSYELTDKILSLPELAEYFKEIKK